MSALGLQGVVRGKPVRTTVSDKDAPCPLDRVNRDFRAPAPNMLWLSDFTYGAPAGELPPRARDMHAFRRGDQRGGEAIPAEISQLARGSQLRIPRWRFGAGSRIWTEWCR